jgi:hypothetical protein
LPCFRPLQAYWSRKPNHLGNYYPVFNQKEGYLDRPLKLPCGQCIGCRLEKSRQWAIRCAHEAQMYENNAFITLTFNDDFCPNSLDVRHFQLFMKRLRKKYGSGIRFFHCGEYGEKHFRPHYHACLFNHDFMDKKPWKITNGHTIYRSAELEGLWSCPTTYASYGYSSTADVTFQSAAYVARYIMKKITGEASDAHYEGKKPEYTTMSNRPGLGKAWLNQYSSDIYPGDFVVINGKKMRPPKYYDIQFEHEYPSDFKSIKSKRLTSQRLKVDKPTDRRLKVIETVTLSKISSLPREIE